MIIRIAIATVLIALGAGWYVYQKIDSKLTRLTPEVIEALKQSTALENEGAIAYPRSQTRTSNAATADKEVYFGDLHVHTAWSFDAYLGGARLGPDEAYLFAQGKPLKVISGKTAQLSLPLDFAAVTDHAESYGLFEGCADPSISPEQADFCAQFENPSVGVFLKLRDEGTRRPPIRNGFCGEGGAFCIEHGKTTWKRTQQAADKAYQPGVFTTFYGYEYSPAWPKARGSTHRNVIFRNKQVPDKVVSAYDAATALDLWRLLEAGCVDSCEFLTIPHNLNRYYGKAYSRKDEDGAAYTLKDWERRDQYEPAAEIIQVKGASECALGVGTTDEECQFEQFFSPCETGEVHGCAGAGSYARDGLKLGLELREELGFNPLQIGFIGSTDTHNATPGDTEEWDYRGKSNFNDAGAEKRLKKRSFGPAAPITHNPGGLAAIWAPENTRDALFEGLMQRETYATSGTRIRLRVFAGWDFEASLLQDPELVQKAYQSGVPMGGVLDNHDTGLSGGQNPKLLVWAMKDPIHTNLDRIQVIKAWLEDGEQKESVMDIACANGATPDPQSHRCPADKTEVDLSSCKLNFDSGDVEMRTLWEDTDFNPTHATFYYVRVIQKSSCRWSSYDTIRLGMDPITEVSATIQERAWSSPIWYEPTEATDPADAK